MRNDPALASASSTDNQQTSVPQTGYLVLGGTSVKVTNNFDSVQSAPADQPREVLRHVSLQIRHKESNQVVPYIVVSMDLLRDGRPVLQDQPLVPMVAGGADTDQMQYGNNVYRAEPAWLGVRPPYQKRRTCSAGFL